MKQSPNIQLFYLQIIHVEKLLLSSMLSINYLRFFIQINLTIRFVIGLHF